MCRAECTELAGYHEREYDGGGLDALDEPHDDRADDLNAGEEVDAQRLDVPYVDVVRLVLGRHQQDQATLHELHHNRTVT